MRSAETAIVDVVWSRVHVAEESARVSGGLSPTFNRDVYDRSAQTENEFPVHPLDGYRALARSFRR